MTASAKKGANKAVVLALVLVLAALCVFGALYVTGSGPFGRQAYPLEYEALIAQYAAEYGLDPYLVAAVIHTESGFDPAAVSRVGAVGLMQVMPETGEWIAGKLGVENYDDSMLLEPEVSIRFGCWYLDFLDEKFGGDQKLVMAAYNAGHNRVAGWLEDGAVTSDGQSISGVPYAETEKYVDKVSNATEKYKEYYTIG